MIPSDDPTAWLRGMQPRLAGIMGLRILSANHQRVEAEVVVSEDLTNLAGVMHGGAIMALADNMAGTATALLLRPGDRTTTIESKTNFMRPVAGGDLAHLVSTPLHVGRRTIVWETRISGGDGRLAAIVTQTQIVIGATAAAEPDTAVKA